jgi:branched-subunit amino acid ABC-type transport system permease component
MATPKVAAVAGLLIAKYGAIKPNQLQNLLYKSAVDPVDGEEKEFFGAGHLNAFKALSK